jgi:hypothetical protein
VHDLISLQPNLQLTLSGRYNDTRVSTVDDGRITLGLPTTLDGEGRYRKFNPAAGLTWQATPTLTLIRQPQPGQPRAQPDRAGLLRPGQRLRAAERAAVRPAAQAGGLAHAGSRCARQVRAAAAAGTPRCSAP